MEKNIVVEGCVFEIYEAGLLNPTGVCNVSSTCVPSAKSKADNKKIYCGQLLVEVSGFSSSVNPSWIPLSGSTTTPVGLAVPGNVTTTATKTKVDNKLVFLEGDQAMNVTIYGKQQSGQTTIDATATVNIKVKSAGQTKAKGV